MTTRIEIEDLNVYYGDFLAVEDAAITMDPQTVTAFIGPSGCGKSTVLRTLNRMHEVVLGGWLTGTVRLDGQNHNVAAGFKLAGIRKSKNDMDGIVEDSLKRRTSGRRSSSAYTVPVPGCPAASSSGCASPGRSRSSRRCC